MPEETPSLAASSKPRHEEMQPITLALILHTLHRGRRPILIATLVITLMALGVSYLLPNTYSSTATFIPPSAGLPSGLGALMGQISAASGGSLLGGEKTQGDLYVGILNSRSVLSLMVDRFKLKGHYGKKSEAAAENALLKRSTFTVNTKNTIVTVIVEDSSPSMAHDLAEGYLGALENTNQHLALTESSSRRAFFEQRLRQEKDALTEAEVALQQGQKQSGLIAPAGQTATQIQTLSSLQAQISGLQVRLSAMLQNETEENPEIIQVRRQIGTLQLQVQQMELGNSGTEYGRFSAAQLPALQMESIRRSRDLKYHEVLFDIISKQYEAARLDETKDEPMQVLDHADYPESPSGPRRKLIIALGAIFGLALSSAWVLGRTALRRSPQRNIE